MTKSQIRSRARNTAGNRKGLNTLLLLNFLYFYLELQMRSTNPWRPEEKQPQTFSCRLKKEFQ